MVKKLVAGLVLLLVCTAAGAGEVFGTVDALSGNATVSGEDGSATTVTVGLKIYEKDTLTTGPDTEVHIVTEDGALIALRPGTVFRVDEYKAEGGENDRTFVSLLRGALRSVTGWIGKRNHAAYRVTTPTATIGVRGTDHEITVIDKGDGDEPGTYDTVNEGATVMKTPQGEAEGAPGKSTFAPKGKAVAPAVLARPPHFLAARRLRLEERISQRKEYLRAHHEQMREERIRNLQQGRAERPGEMRTKGQAQQMQPSEEAPAHRRERLKKGNGQHREHKGHRRRERE